MAFPNVKYTGSTPGGDSNTYNIINSYTMGWPGNWPAMFGIYKVIIDIKHDQAGTLKWYKNMSDNDTGWVQMGQLAVAAPASTAGTQAEVFVEAERHVKIDWVNGGSAQSPFSVNIALVDQRAQI